MFDLRDFLTSEDGAVTVDWVVLTAAVIALGIVTSMPSFTAIKSATNVLAEQIASDATAEP